MQGGSGAAAAAGQTTPAAQREVTPRQLARLSAADVPALENGGGGSGSARSSPASAGSDVQLAGGVLHHPAHSHPVCRRRALRGPASQAIRLQTADIPCMLVVLSCCKRGCMRMPKHDVWDRSQLVTCHQHRRLLRLLTWAADVVWLCRAAAQWLVHPNLHQLRSLGPLAAACLIEGTGSRLFG